jgi:hypothetical protein
MDVYAHPMKEGSLSKRKTFAKNPKGSDRGFLIVKKYLLTNI